MLRRNGGTSAVLAIKQIAHSFAAGGVGALIGLQRIGRLRSGRFFFAAIRTAVGESGLAGLEFEFFAADDAGFDGISHAFSIIQLSC